MTLSNSAAHSAWVGFGVFSAAAACCFAGALLSGRIPEQRIATLVLTMGLKAGGWICAATAVILLLVAWTSA